MRSLSGTRVASGFQARRSASPRNDHRGSPLLAAPAGKIAGDIGQARRRLLDEGQRPADRNGREPDPCRQQPVEHALAELGRQPRRQSLAEHLLDHRIDGKGVLPAAGALEWMAQFVTAAWPGWHVVEMRDLRQLNSVMLDPEINGGKRSVQLRARASSHSDHNGQNITVEIIDPAKKLPFYRATAVLQQQMPEAPEIRVEALQQGKPFAASDAYAHFLFHGPRFQLVTTISRVSEEGLDAEVKPCRPTDWLPAAKGHWVFDPGLVDVPPQMALVWARLNRGMSALPSRFGAVLRYGNAAMPASLRLLMRMRPPPHEAAAVYDALFVDELGRLRLEMRDCESTMSAALNRLGGQASKPGQPNEGA